MDAYPYAGEEYSTGGIEEDETYRQSLAYLQQGRWEQAMELILQLRRRYGDIPEVLDLLQEASFRATVQGEEDESSASPTAQPAVMVGATEDLPGAEEIEDDPLYHQSLAYLQQGQWGEALGVILRLREQYGDVPEIQSLLQEVSFKAALDHELSASPQEPTWHSRWERWWAWGRWVLLALLLVLIAAAAVVVVNRQTVPPPMTQEEELRLAQLRQQGQFYLAARQYDRAIQAFEDVLAESPNDRVALEGIATAQKKKEIETLRQRAIELLEAQDWGSALRAMDEIERREPGYGGLAEERALAERQLQLERLFEEAEIAHHLGDWKQAIFKYEQLQTLDRNYRKAVVAERLFEAYVRRGQELVSTSAESLDAVREAHELFVKALTIHPGDPQVVTERDLAEAYIDGRQAYDAGNWHRAAELLGWLYASRPDYTRTLGLLLYEAFLRSGQVYEAQGDLRSALVQYQRALAVEVGDHSQAEARIATLTASPMSTPAPIQTSVPVLAPTSPAPIEPVGAATPVPTPTPTLVPTPSWQYDYTFMGARPNCERTGVMGVIRDEHGLPVQGVQVRLWDSIGGVWTSAPSNEDGEYKITVAHRPLAATWTIAVMAGEQRLSPSYSFRTSLGCANGLQEYKIDWRRKGD